MDFSLLGKLGKRFGTEGLIRVQIDKDKIPIWEDLLNQKKAIFVGIDGFKIPFFVKSFDAKKSLVSFFKIRNDDEMIELLGQSLYTNIKFHSTEEDLDLQVLIGFSIQDSTSGQTTSEIIRIDQNPAHPMAVVQKDGEDLLIPLVEEWIQKIEHGKGLIRMDLPVGLLDLVD